MHCDKEDMSEWQAYIIMAACRWFGGNSILSETYQTETANIALYKRAKTENINARNTRFDNDMRIIYSLWIIISEIIWGQTPYA